MTTRHPYIWIIGSIVFLLIAAAIAARLYFPYWIKDFVNRQLASIPGYEGEVQDITVHLYRGAYTIHEMEIRKMHGKIPVPFVSIPTMDLSVEWGALFHGRIVSQIEADNPVLNFAVNPEGTETQTGKGIDWTQRVKKLMPIDIDRVGIVDGRIAYRDFSTDPQVNLHIHHIEGEVRNLRNVVEKNHPLPSTLHFTGDSIGHGRLQVDGRMNALAEPLELEMALKLEKVNLPALNDYFRSYFGVDVAKGDFDLYSELAVHHGEVRGYIKPIATHISMLDTHKEHNPLQLAWEAVVSAVVDIFTNHRKDQFATKVPLSGHIGKVGTDDWAAIAGIIRNAFIQAISKGTEGELGNLHPAGER